MEGVSIYYVLLVVGIFNLFINLSMIRFLKIPTTDKENATQKLVSRINHYLLVAFICISLIQIYYFTFYTQSIFAFFGLTSFVSFYLLRKREKQTKEYVLAGINFVCFALTFLVITFSI